MLKVVIARLFTLILVGSAVARSELLLTGPWFIALQVNVEYRAKLGLL